MIQLKIDAVSLDVSQRGFKQPQEQPHDPEDNGPESFSTSLRQRLSAGAAIPRDYGTWSAGQLIAACRAVAIAWCMAGDTSDAECIGHA